MHDFFTGGQRVQHTHRPNAAHTHSTLRCVRKLAAVACNYYPDTEGHAFTHKYTIHTTQQPNFFGNFSPEANATIQRYVERVTWTRASW